MKEQSRHHGCDEDSNRMRGRLKHGIKRKLTKKAFWVDRFTSCWQSSKMNALERAVVFFINPRVSLTQWELTPRTWFYHRRLLILRVEIRHGGYEEQPRFPGKWKRRPRKTPPAMGMQCTIMLLRFRARRWGGAIVWACALRVAAKQCSKGASPTH